MNMLLRAFFSHQFNYFELCTLMVLTVRYGGGHIHLVSYLVCCAGVLFCSCLGEAILQLSNEGTNQ